MSSASAPLRKSPSGPKASASGPVPAAFGVIPSQPLPAGPTYARISDIVSFDDWEPGDIVIIHAACTVLGAGDIFAFNVALLPAVSLDGGATWQAIIAPSTGPLVFGASQPSGGVAIPVLAAVECPSAPLVAIWNNGGGATNGGYVAAVRARSGGSAPGTTLGAFP